MKKKNTYLFIIAAAFLWGAVGVPVRELAAFGLSSLQIVVLRFVTALAVFGLYIFLTDRQKLRLEKQDVKYFAAYSVFCLLLYNLCFATALQITSLSVAVGLLYTSPVWAMLLSIYFFKEKLTKKKCLAIILSFAGCGLITGLLTAGGMNLTPVALLVGLCAGMGYGFQGVFIKKFMQKYNQVTVVFYSFLFAAAAGIALCKPWEMAQIIAAAPASMIYGFGGTLLCYVLPFALYTYALNYTEASKAAVVVSVEPVFTAFLGFLVYSEPITPAVIAGTALIISAVAVLYEYEKPKR
jgi:drug/metabolite transporter (DMT)-like permease